MSQEDGLPPAESLPPSVDLRAAQRKTSLTAQYPFAGLGTVQAAMYIGLGIAGEAGELANQVKKIARDDGGMCSAARRDKIFSELGDVIWYWLRFCEEFNFDPNDVIRANQEKLLARLQNGTVRGDGEVRASLAHLNSGAYAGKEVSPDGTLRPSLASPSAAGTVVPGSFGASGIGSAVHAAIEQEAQAQREAVTGGVPEGYTYDDVVQGRVAPRWPSGGGDQNEA